MEPLQELWLSLGGLVLSSFLSATILPGSSEAVLTAVLVRSPELGALSVLLATLGNTLGGMTTYGMGFLLPSRVQARLSARVLAGAQRWGALSLLLSWVPGVGDGLCLAAGWLRLPILPVFLCMILGKALRYGVLAAGVLWWVQTPSSISGLE